MRLLDRLIECMGAALEEQSETFDPEWLAKHLDYDRLRHDLEPEIRAMLVEEGRNDEAEVAYELTALLQDPGELRAVLGEDLSDYIDRDSAAQDAASHDVWEHVPGIHARLDYAIKKLDAQ